MICISIDYGRKNTVGESSYSVHQAITKFAEHHMDIVSSGQCKFQTRAGVSGDVNKTLECFTITDSKFYNRVLE